MNVRLMRCALACSSLSAYEPTTRLSSVARKAAAAATISRSLEAAS